MSLIEPMLQEIEMEAATTRRVLERVPTEHLGWQPHAKSMTLGALAQHVALVPRRIAEFVQASEFERPTGATAPPLSSGEEIVQAFDAGMATTRELLAKMSDEDLLSPWTMKVGGKAIFTLPKIGVLRRLLCNHSYHHRGQLSVYLRLLDVPVPSIYGPTADENPFA